MSFQALHASVRQCCTWTGLSTLKRRFGSMWKQNYNKEDSDELAAINAQMLKVIHCNYKLHTSLNIIINAGNTCGLVIERQIKSQGVCFAGRAQGDYSVSTSESTCVKWPRLNLPLLTCTVHFLLPPKFLHLLHPAVALHLSSNMFFPLWSQYPEGKTHLQKYANVNIILLHLCYSIFILFLNSLMCKWMQHDSKPSPLQHMSHSEKFHSVVYIWSVLAQDVSIF